MGDQYLTGTPVEEWINKYRNKMPKMRPPRVGGVGAWTLLRSRAEIWRVRFPVAGTSKALRQERAGVAQASVAGAPWTWREGVKGGQTGEQGQRLWASCTMEKLGVYCRWHGRLGEGFKLGGVGSMTWMLS